MNCFGAVNQNPLIAGAERDTSFVAGSQIGFVASGDRIVLCAESHHTMGFVRDDKGRWLVKADERLPGMMLVPDISGLKLVA